MIELKSIEVVFNKGTQLENHALKHLHLKIPEGEWITIIGGNGAGKSTLMNVISGDVAPVKGKILIDNQDVTALSTQRRAPMVARIFQDPLLGTFSELTIEENMSVAYKRGQSRGLGGHLNTTLRERFKEGLSELGMGLENRLKDKVAGLSGGQRQALSLIMATLQSSKILLLDEHTAALDPKIAKAIMEVTSKVIKNHHLTVLMITHSMTQALEYGQRTLLMHHGKILHDMKGEDRKKLSPDDLLAYFGE